MGFGVRLCHMLTLAAVALAGSACSSNTERDVRQYALEGQILAVRPESSEVVIKHGDIAGFMPGMTMPFKVKDAALLQGRAAGDLVKATLMVADTEAWIGTIEKTGSAPLPAEAPASVPTAANVDLLDVGDEVPHVGLTAEDGTRVTPADWRGKAFAITFIYTRCPLPQFCPLMDRRFAEVQRLVAAQAGLTERVRLLTISFDPDADTPAVLAAHARTLEANPTIWRFATAPGNIVDAFAVRFGVNVIREADKTITHNLVTATIGPDGRIVGLYRGGEWTARQIVDDFQRALGGSAR